MAVKIEVPYSKTFRSPKDVSSTMKYFSDFESSIPKAFPGLERFEKVEPAVYRWAFEKVRYQNYEFEIKLVTRFTVHADKIEMKSVPQAGHSNIEGSWSFTPQGDGTDVTFQAKLDTELPLPFFLKAVAGPIAQKELSKLFDRYITNVGKALA